MSLDQTDAPTVPKEVDPLAVLASMPPVFAGDQLSKALKKAGDKRPAETAGAWLADGLLKSFGNGHDAEGKPNKEYRFKAVLPLEGGTFWVRPLKGYGAGLKVAGLILDRFGAKVELTSATRAEFEGRDCPVEVISDPKEIAKLEVDAKRRAEAAGRVFDKTAETLGAFA